MSIRKLKKIIKNLPIRKFPAHLYDMPVKHLNNGITAVYIDNKIYHYKTVKDGFVRYVEITTKRYGIKLECARIGAKARADYADG